MADKPFSAWWNATQMYFRTHVKTSHKGISGTSGDNCYDGMVEHDCHVDELLKLVDDLKLAKNAIVMYSTDNGVYYNTWPGTWLTGETFYGIVAHEDWLPPSPPQPTMERSSNSSRPV